MSWREATAALNSCPCWLWRYNFPPPPTPWSPFRSVRKKFLKCEKKGRNRSPNPVLSCSVTPHRPKTLEWSHLWSAPKTLNWVCPGFSRVTPHRPKALETPGQTQFRGFGADHKWDHSRVFGRCGVTGFWGGDRPRWSHLCNFVLLRQRCLLWIDKARAKDKTYIWVSVWWKTTN